SRRGLRSGREGVVGRRRRLGVAVDLGASQAQVPVTGGGAAAGPLVVTLLDGRVGRLALAGGVGEVERLQGLLDVVGDGRARDRVVIGDDQPDAGGDWYRGQPRQAVAPGGRSGQGRSRGVAPAYA